MTPHWAPSPVTATADGRSFDTRRPSARLAEAGHCGPGPAPPPAPPPAPAAPAAPSEPAVSCTLSPRPESVRASRDFTRAALEDWGMPGLVDSAELVVSELVTNALRHGITSARPEHADRSVRLRLLAQRPLVMCMVTDPGSDIPVRRAPSPSAESGRGLAVVEFCSVRWGWHLRDGGGKVVWALLRPEF